jgi:hypothetical protein
MNSTTNETQDLYGELPQLPPCPSLIEVAERQERDRLARIAWEEDSFFIADPTVDLEAITEDLEVITEDLVHVY